MKKVAGEQAASAWKAINSSISHSLQMRLRGPWRLSDRQASNKPTCLLQVPCERKNKAEAHRIFSARALRCLFLYLQKCHAMFASADVPISTACLTHNFCKRLISVCQALFLQIRTTKIMQFRIVTRQYCRQRVHEIANPGSLLGFFTPPQFCSNLRQLLRC